MLDERRTEIINFRLPPSLRAAVEADRIAKGQPLVEWMERAVKHALAVSDMKHETSS